MGNKRTILIVEDEPAIARLVGYHLQRAGFSVDYASTGTEALKKVKKGQYLLVILDLMLPEMDGLEFCRIVRTDPQFSLVPIIMLTARDEEVDKITGLEMGADDYITKPFSPKELVARVKAVLRRVRTQEVVVSEQVRPLVRGPFRFEPEKFRVLKNGKEVPLSAREFRLFYHLASFPGRVFTREKLLDDVWGDEVYVEPRTVDVHIRRLREKIENNPSKPKYILTKRGVGYYFSEE